MKPMLMTRREVLELLGAGAAAAAVPFAAFAQAPTFQKGAIIRTLLKDYAPEELAGGATLFHEHMQLAPDFMREIRCGGGRGSRRERPAAGAGARRRSRRCPRRRTAAGPGHHARRRPDVG